MLRLLLLPLLVAVVCSGTDVAVSTHVIRNGTVVCSSITLAEHVPEDVLHVIRDCTHVDGHVKLLVMHVLPRHMPLMPRLVEVKDSVALFHVSGVEKVGDLFPKLRVVRGNKGRVGFFLKGNEDLIEIGLPSLTLGSPEAGLEIVQNWQLCVPAVAPYTVAPASIKDNGVYCEYGHDGCHFDDLSCKQFVATKCSCTNGCASTELDRHAARSVAGARSPKTECCHPHCLGGCSVGGDAGACTACKHFVQEGYCVQRCSEGYMQYLDYRCVTAQQCRALGGKRLTKAQMTLCVQQCPPGSVAEGGSAGGRLSQCTRTGNGVCGSIAMGGGVEEGVAVHTTTPPVNCTRVVGSVTLKGAFNASQLESMASLFAENVEVTDYVLVTETSLMSLDFLFNKLALVRGNNLVEDVYSIYISDNMKLQELRRPRPTAGATFPHDTRVVERGEVMVRGNSKLCPSEVVNLLGTRVTSATRRLNDGSSATLECFEDFSQEHNERNDVNVPCRLSGIEVRQLRATATSLTVAWDPHSYKGPNKSHLQGYFLYYRAVAPGTSVRMFEGRDACNDRRLWQQVQTSETKVKADENAELTLQGLQPGTRYALYIETDVFPTFVENSYHSMPGSRSHIVYCTTLPLVPSQPRQLDVRQSTSGSRSGGRQLHSVSVAWAPPARPGGLLAGYQVMLCRVRRPYVAPARARVTVGFCPTFPGPPSGAAPSVATTAASTARPSDVTDSTSAPAADYHDGQLEEDQFCDSHHCHRSDEEWLHAKLIQERIYFFKKINTDIFERGKKINREDDIPVPKISSGSQSVRRNAKETTQLDMPPIFSTPDCRPYRPLNISHQPDVCETRHPPVNWTLYSNVVIDVAGCEVHYRPLTSDSTTFHGLEPFQDFQVSVRACQANTTAPPLTFGGESAIVALCSSWTNYTNTTASQKSLDAVTNLQMEELKGKSPPRDVLVIEREEFEQTARNDEELNSDGPGHNVENNENFRSGAMGDFNNKNSSLALDKNQSKNKQLDLKNNDSSSIEEKVSETSSLGVSSGKKIEIQGSTVHSLHGVEPMLRDFKAAYANTFVPEATSRNDENRTEQSVLETISPTRLSTTVLPSQSSNGNVDENRMAFLEVSEKLTDSVLNDSILLFSKNTSVVSQESSKDSKPTEPKANYLVSWTPPRTPNGGVVLNYTLEIPGYMVRCLIGTVSQVLLVSVPRSRASSLVLTAHTMAGIGPRVRLSNEVSEMSTLQLILVVVLILTIVFFIAVIILICVLQKRYNAKVLSALNEMHTLDNPSYAPAEIDVDHIVPAEHLLILPADKGGLLGRGQFGTVSLGYVLRPSVHEDLQDDVPHKFISSFSKTPFGQQRLSRATEATMSGVEVGVSGTQADEDEFNPEFSGCRDSFRRDRVSFNCPLASLDHMNDSGVSSTRDEDLEEKKESSRFFECEDSAQCLDRGSSGIFLGVSGEPKVGVTQANVENPKKDVKKSENASSPTITLDDENEGAKMEAERQTAREELKIQKGREWRRWVLHKRVAVKELVCNESDQTPEEQALRKKKFNREASIMQCLMQCPFVVRFEGAAMRETQMCILMEVLEGGNLEDYIKAHPVSVQDVYDFGIQVADGMAYIASKRIIHIDLAARNCLMSRGRIVKIADFGFSRKLAKERLYYHYQLDWTRRQHIFLPKFLAPEARRNDIHFYLKSDVWAFGLLLWELLTRADRSLNNQKPPSRETIRAAYLSACGEDLLALDSPFLESLLERCWQQQQQLRPSFEEIVKMLLPKIEPGFVREFRRLSFSLCQKTRESESTEDEGLGSMPGSSRDEVDSSKDLADQIEQSRSQCCFKFLNITGSRHRDSGDATGEGFSSRRQQLVTSDGSRTLSNVAEKEIAPSENDDAEENFDISSYRTVNRRHFSSAKEAPLYEERESERFLSNDQNTTKAVKHKRILPQICSVLTRTTVSRTADSKVDRRDASKVSHAEEKPLIHTPSYDDSQGPAKPKLHLPLNANKYSSPQINNPNVEVGNQSSATEQHLASPLIPLPSREHMHNPVMLSHCSCHKSAERYLDMSPKNPNNEFLVNSADDIGKNKWFTSSLNDTKKDETSVEDNMLGYTEMGCGVSLQDLDWSLENEMLHNESDDKCLKISKPDDFKPSAKKHAASSCFLTTSHETKAVVPTSVGSSDHLESSQKDESGYARFFFRDLKLGKSFHRNESFHNDSCVTGTRSYAGGSCEDFSLVTCPSFDTLYPSASTCTSAVASPCDEFSDITPRVNCASASNIDDVSKSKFSDLYVNNPETEHNKIGRPAQISAESDKKRAFRNKNGVVSEHLPGNEMVKLSCLKADRGAKFGDLYNSGKSQDEAPCISLTSTRCTETKS